MRRGLSALAVSITVLAGTSAGAQPDVQPTVDFRSPALAWRPQNQQIVHDPAGVQPVLGPRYAPVTIDFFMKLSSQSRKMHGYLMKLRARHPRRVRIVYRLVPQARDHLVNEAALEAFAQGRFQQFMDDILTTSPPPREKTAIAEACARTGVDYRLVETAWHDHRHDALLQRNDIELKWRTSSSSVPVLLFNGVNPGRTNGLNFDKIEDHYRDAYEVARKALDRGVPLAYLYDALLRDLDLAVEPMPLVVGSLDGVSQSELQRLQASAPLVDQNATVPGHSIGPTDAPVAVHFYCSFLSSNCALLKQKLDIVRQEFRNQVQLVFHHMFPELDHAADEHRRDLILLHQAALCASEQYAFWDFYHRAYLKYPPRRRHQLNTVEHVAGIVGDIGISPQRHDDCMNRLDGKEDVMNLVRAARKAGITRTPTLVIGGRIYLGIQSPETLRRLVRAELLPGLVEQFFPTWVQDEAAFQR